MTVPSDRFGQFVLRGPDFDKRGMPVEAAAELIAYKALVLDVAKKLFLQENPERERSQRNLSVEFDLRLEAIEPGSADLQITLERPSTLLDTLAPLPDIFERSRDLVTSAIHEVSKTGLVPRDFPVKSLPKFRSLGKTLRDGHSILIGDTNSRFTAAFDLATRANFLKILTETSRVVPQDKIGTVVELDPERMVFHLRTPDDERILCYYGSQMGSVSKQFLVDENGDGPLVVVHGDALVGSDGAIERFSSVSAIDAVEEATVELQIGQRGERLRERLHAIEGLTAGWLDSQSQAVSGTIMSRAWAMVGKLRSIPDNFTPAPLPDGGLRFEWSNGLVDFVAELEFDGGMYLCALDESSEDDIDFESPIMDEDMFLNFVQKGVSSLVSQ